MKNVQTIMDLHANATQGPLSLEVIDDHSGRPGSKSWLIPFAVRGKYGNNALNFDEDEATGRFVAASFTAVPEMAARLQAVDELVTRMEDMLAGTIPDGADFEWYVSELRNALGKDVSGDRLPLV